MAAVTVTIDLEQLRTDDAGAVIVRSIADYAPTCLLLRQALRDGSSLHITVRNRAVAAWFERLAATYGEQRIAVQCYTPRDALRDLWQIDIPSTVSDRDILQSKLLEERVAAREGQSFADLLLGHFYSDKFGFRTFPTSQLGEILNEYAPDRWKAAARRPLVGRTLRERLNRWEEVARSDAIVALVRALRDDPAGLRRDLASFRVLAAYPAALGERVLGDRWEVFKKLRVETEAIHLSPVDLAGILPEIEYYLTDRLASLATSDDVAALVELMSGCLSEEFSTLEKALTTRPEWITLQLLRRIEARFRPIQAAIAPRLTSLRQMVKPPFPMEPQATWSASEWLSWASESYMPYYAWLETQKQHDDTVGQYADRFADWYYFRFCSLKASEPECFAFSALFLDRESILASDTVAVIILLDNFNYAHFGELCSICREKGLFLETSRPVLSLIPSATEVGKAALIASRGDQVDLPNIQYAELVQAEWQPLLGQKSVSYLANLGELQQLTTLSHGVYFLNFLAVDRALHQDAQETGRPHHEVIRDHLNTLVTAVAEFARRFGIEHRLRVHILSDHGSTRIARGTVNVLDKSYYKSLADEKHHRYLALSDQQFQRLPQVAGAQCYLIESNQFKTRRNYLAARHYFRFSETTDDYYVHGGLTPEEVVVPYARFSLLPVTPEAPTLSLPTSQFRYAVTSRILVEIGNPNPFPLESVSIRMIDDEGDEVFLDLLPSKRKSTAEFVTRFRKPPGGASSRDLTLRVRFGYQGQQYSPPDRTFQITMRTLMEVTDDNFDF